MAEMGTELDPDRSKKFVG